MDRLLSYHASRREVRTLLVLLSIFQHSVKGKNSRRYEIVWLQKVKVLTHLVMILKRGLLPYIMIYAKINILASLLLFFHKASC